MIQRTIYQIFKTLSLGIQIRSINIPTLINKTLDNQIYPVTPED